MASELEATRRKKAKILSPPPFDGKAELLGGWLSLVKSYIFYYNEQFYSESEKTIFAAILFKGVA